MIDPEMEISHLKRCYSDFWGMLKRNNDFYEEFLIRSDSLRDDHSRKEDLLRFLEWCDVRIRELYEKNERLLERGQKGI
jgi:hypothetical protein